MFRKKYLFGVLALGLGVLAGTLGVLMFSNSSSPTSFISKLRGQDKIQTVSGAVSEPIQPSMLNSADNPAVNTASQPSDGQTFDQGKVNMAATDALNSLNQEIIADYKQDIGVFFDAWKSPDMTTFRQKLSKAYTGDLLEKHVRRAESYLLQGIGLDVSQINFDKIEIESSDANTATLRADYRYTARDYSLTDSASLGDSHEQNVHDRVNLIKENSRWVITGESMVQ
jgi:hypothetical protein